MKMKQLDMFTENTNAACSHENKQFLDGVGLQHQLLYLFMWIAAQALDFLFIYLFR